MVKHNKGAYGYYIEKGREGFSGCIIADQTNKISLYNLIQAYIAPPPDNRSGYCPQKVQNEQMAEESIQTMRRTAKALNIPKVWTTGSCIYTLDEAKQAIDELARNKKERLQMTPSGGDKENDQQSALVAEIGEPAVAPISTAEEYRPSATITKEEYSML